MSMLYVTSLSNQHTTSYPLKAAAQQDTGIGSLHSYFGIYMNKVQAAPDIH